MRSPVPGSRRRQSRAAQRFVHASWRRHQMPVSWRTVECVSSGRSICPVVEALLPDRAVHSIYVPELRDGSSEALREVAMSRSIS